MRKPGNRQSNTLIHIAISQQCLAQLLDARSITVSDIQCLDARSKREVWRTCLEASLLKGSTD